MEQKGTLKYRKVQRTPQTGENAGKKKWYATSVTDREVDFEGFVSHISDHGSPYSRGTIHGVLMDALDHLQELILDGKSVRLSDLGLFSIGMSSKAEDTKEKVTAACSAIDGMHIENLVGTLAGDDTAFLAMRDNDSALRLYHEIETIL